MSNALHDLAALCLRAPERAHALQQALAGDPTGDELLLALFAHKVAPDSAPPDSQPAGAAGRLTDMPLRIQLSDTGNAARFVEQFGHAVRYTVGQGWLVWDGKRFAPDTNNVKVTSHMTEIGRAWFDQSERVDKSLQAGYVRHAVRTLNSNGLENALKRAARIFTVLAHEDEFDADPMLLNTQNGVLDLRTGALLPHDPKYLCTRVTGAAYVPDASAPRWQRFREEIFGHNTALIDFDRCWDGYCLTGMTHEQRYVIAWGNGANGKSTKFDAIRHVMGDYALDIRVMALMARFNGSDVNTDLARLPGARLAICPEWAEGMQADESMLKSLTGQDVITVRTLFQKPFSFKPKAKIVIYGNYMPALRGRDKGTWRRPVLMPFTQSFEGDLLDKKLPDTLADEAEGILADCVRGCMQWQRDGLVIPAEVQAATEEFRRDSNDVLAFIAAMCVINPNAHTSISRLFAAYQAWGGAARTPKKFGMLVREAGYVTQRNCYGYEVLGLGLDEVNNQPLV